MTNCAIPPISSSAISGAITFVVSMESCSNAHNRRAMALARMLERRLRVLARVADAHPDDGRGAHTRARARERGQCAQVDLRMYIGSA